VGLFFKGGILAGSAALFLVAALPLNSIPQKPSDGERLEPSVNVDQRPADLEGLMATARMSAPEIAVDILVSIARSKRVNDPVWQREILEEAYRTAGEARNQVKKKAVPLKGVPVDTHAGYLSYAYDLKLDALSLRSRVIRQMLAIDKERARQIVFEINGRLDLKRLECEDSLVYDVADIYAAAGAVAKAAFSSKEIEDGVRAMFILPWFENIESPAQIAPAVDLFAEFQSIPLERQILSTAFSRAISRNFSDDRSFTFSVEWERSGSKLYRLTTGIDDPSKLELRTAYRDFMLKNLRSGRCSGNEISDSDALPAYVVSANQIHPEKPLTFDDVVHSDVLASPRIRKYWQSTESRRLQTELRRLRVTNEGNAITEEDKAGEEWQTRVNTLLENIAAWNAGGDETESDVFNQKSILYRTIVGLVPDGRIKGSVFRGYMRFLHSAPMQKENFVEWYFHVRRLADDDPELFYEMTSEFTNPHFRLMSAIRRTQL
jgi:hypothetical protein